MRGENEGRRCSCASPQPGFDSTDPALPAEIHQDQSSNSCCQAVEQLRCARCRDKPDLSHIPRACPGSWTLSPGPAVPLCPPVSPYLSWLQPLAGPPSEEPLWEQEEQEDLRVLGCHMGGRTAPGASIRSWGTAGGQRKASATAWHCPGVRELQGPNREKDLSLANAASHSSQAGPTTGNHSSGELRRKEREQRAPRRENHG